MASWGYKGGNKILSKTEAEKLLETEVRNKDFWAVTAAFDNCMKLQKIIDVLYNDIPGNEYEVIYQENQNGTRLTIHCNVCTKELSSYDPFIAHENGKPHKKIRQQKLTPKDPNLSTKLQRRPHNEPRGVFAKGTLEEQIDSSTEIVLGIQFVYKEVIHGQELFTCQLCQKGGGVSRVKTSTMFKHLTGRSHNRKYMEVKFGLARDRYTNVDEEARYIEENEGKIHQMIIDFSGQLKMQEDSTQSPSSQSRKRSRSHSRSRSPHSQSPSCSRRSRSRSSSSSSRSPGSIEEVSTSSGAKPKSKRAAEKDEKDDVIPLPPPIPSTPDKVDVELTCDMYEDPRPILKEVQLLQQNDCREMLLEDKDMQACMIQTVWALNLKLEKFFKTEAELESSSMIEATNKVKEYIKQLTLITSDDD